MSDLRSTTDIKFPKELSENIKPDFKSDFGAVYGLKRDTLNGRGDAILPDSIIVDFDNTVVERKLATVKTIDINDTNTYNLYRVLNGRTLIVTKLILRKASASLTTARFSIGYNSTSFNDVVSDSAYTALTGNSLYQLISPKNGAAIGEGGQILKMKVNTPQGSAATVTIDIIGILL